MSDQYLLVKPSSNHRELLEEYTSLIALLHTKKINFLELCLEKDLKSEKYLCSRDWILFQGKGDLAVFPMATIERQQERNDVVFDVLEAHNFVIRNIVDFTEAELDGFFLEGAGSVVLDHVNNFAYASVSQNCDEELFVEFCEELEFTPVVFNSEFSEVVQTSKILNISEDFIIVASAFIKDKKERKFVSSQLKKSNRELIYISENQALNHLTDIKQVKNSSGDSFILMSKSILENLTNDQKTIFSKYGELLVIDYAQTEKFGKHSIGAAVNDIF